MDERTTARAAIEAERAAFRVEVEPLPEVAAAHARHAARAELAPENAAVAPVIRTKVKYQVAEAESDAFRAAPAPRPQGRRRRACAHPDQLTLAL